MKLDRVILFNRVIFLLSLIGIAMAIYVLQSFIRQAPIVCVNSGCELVRKSTVSYPFGIPVPAFGLVGYSFLAIFAFLRTMNYEQNTKHSYLMIMLGIGLFGISFVSWFTFNELFIIKAICTWCAISAVNMFIVFGLTLKSYYLEKRSVL